MHEAKYYAWDRNIRTIAKSNWKITTKREREFSDSDILVYYVYLNEMTIFIYVACSK